MQKDIGLVEKKELIKMLRKEYDLRTENVEKIIEDLLRTGFLFVPRRGFIWSTY